MKLIYELPKSEYVQIVDELLVIPDDAPPDVERLYASVRAHALEAARKASSGLHSRVVHVDQVPLTEPCKLCGHPVEQEL
jgi:hypothetical protein